MKSKKPNTETDGADEAQRLDIWLYRVRLFKTRSQATKAAQTGKIRITRNGQTVRVTKGSTRLRPADEIVFMRGKTLLHVQLIAPAHRRGPASEAQKLYNLHPLETSNKPTQKDMPMITVHHLEYSQSFRIVWLMEELGAKYDLKLYERDAKTRLAPADYKALSPLGTAPVISDGGKVICETNAVIDYILDTHGPSPLRPEPGDPARAKYLFWFHAAQGSMMPLLLFHSIFGMIKRRSPFFVRPIIKAALGKAEAAFLRPRMKSFLALAESELNNNKWLAGDTLTAADIVMSYGMEAASNAGFLNDHPNCQRWVEQMHDSASFKRAVEKDGRSQIIFTG